MKKQILFATALTLTLCAGLTGCQSASSDAANQPTMEAQKQEESVTIEHKLGSTTIKGEVNNVLVFDLATVATLDSLGLGDKITGVPKDNKFPEYIKQYKDDKYINLGSVKEIDMEAINAAKPDLIIIGGRQADYYEELSKIAPVVPVEVDWTVNYMDSITETCTMLGTIFGVQDKIDVELEQLNKRLDTINAHVTENKLTALVTLVSDRSMKALGLKSRCSLISNEAGFENLGVGLEDSTHGDSINYEYIVEQDPDYIFVLDRNGVTGNSEAPSAKEVVENELIKNTKAYKNGTIVYLSPEAWYLSEGGLVSTDFMIQEIEAALGLNK